MTLPLRFRLISAFSLLVLLPLPVAAESLFTETIDAFNASSNLSDCSDLRQQSAALISESTSVSWPRVGFNQKNPTADRFTMEIPYSDQWQALGHNLFPSQWRDLTVGVGPMVFVNEGIQDPSCRLERQFTVKTERKTLAQKLADYDKELTLLLPDAAVRKTVMPVIRFTISGRNAALIPTLITNSGSVTPVYRALTVEVRGRTVSLWERTNPYQSSISVNLFRMAASIK